MVVIWVTLGVFIKQLDNRKILISISKGHKLFFFCFEAFCLFISLNTLYAY